LGGEGIKHLPAVLLCAFIIALVSLLAPKARADQQGYPSTILELTNVPTIVSNGVTAQWSSNNFTLRQTGLAYQLVMTGSNLNSGTVYSFFYPTVDGTNYWNVPYCILPTTVNGTNLVITGTNFSRYSLQGFAGMGITFSNGSLDNVLLNMVQTNYVTGNTNVNGGLFYNRPNQ
jgi:hypothetical protein